MLKRDDHIRASFVLEGVSDNGWLSSAFAESSVKVDPILALSSCIVKFFRTEHRLLEIANPLSHTRGPTPHATALSLPRIPDPGPP